MKSMMKIVLGVVSVAMIMAVAAPVAEAQCGAGARNFGTKSGSGLVNMFVDPVGSNGEFGLEYGRFWECGNSANGNNFIPGDPQKKMAPAGTGLCASTDAAQAGGGWWQVGATTQRGTDGLISGTGCFASTCPAGDLCQVVEDWGPGGPPGVDSTAFFVGWRSNETPPDFRYWDFAKFCGTANCSVPMNEFPVPRVESSTRNAGTGDAEIVTGSDRDPSVNVYVQTPTAGPASQLIESYDLMISTGATDPGRDRNSGDWSLLASIPYADAALGGQPIVVPCANEIDDAFIAFGLTFVGGPPGGPVPSQLVGSAIQIECDPNIADPKPKPTDTLRQRPTQRTPTRSRGGR
jgi:hypothetical protein